MKTMSRILVVSLFFIMLSQCMGFSVFADGEHSLVPQNTTTIEINRKEYKLVYLGHEDISEWSKGYSCRDFWRLENAYDDFKDCKLTGELLPESNYPISIKTGEVFIIDYTLKTSSGTFRELLRCDGNTWENMLITEVVIADLPPIRTETMTIGGKEYTANYFGCQDISEWCEPFSCRDFWRLEDAYDDFKDCKPTGDQLPENNYPISIKTGEVFIVDYTLKTSGGTFRELLRCDGNTWENVLITEAVTADLPPIRTKTVTIDGKEYTANYFGSQDISDWSKEYTCRDFWQLENAYDDFKDCKFTGNQLPENNYPISIKTGQVFVIDYTLKGGGTSRELHRCDGNTWKKMLITEEFTID